MPLPGEVQFRTALGFREEYRAFRASHPDIKAAIRTFNECKKAVPARPLPAAMRDHVLKGKLKGIHECHLAPDVLLLYKYVRGALFLGAIIRHDDLYGGRIDNVAKKFAGRLRRSFGE